MLKLLFICYAELFGTMSRTGSTCESTNFNLGIANLLAFHSSLKEIQGLKELSEGLYSSRKLKLLFLRRYLTSSSSEGGAGFTFMCLKICHKIRDSLSCKS
jgi:hypothetical protein